MFFSSALVLYYSFFLATTLVGHIFGFEEKRRVFAAGFSLFLDNLYY